MINNDNIFFERIFNNKFVKNILIIGDTSNSEKFAFKIQQLLLQEHYHVYCVDKQYANIDQISTACDAVVLCMNPIKCVNLLRATKTQLKNVIIQPGAESNDIIVWLNEQAINYTQGCVLKYFAAR